jgi:hypothetical protein
MQTRTTDTEIRTDQGGSLLKVNMYFLMYIGWYISIQVLGTVHEGLNIFILFTAVQSILYLNTSAKGTPRCISMATLSGFLLFIHRCRSATIQREPLSHFHSSNGYMNMQMVVRHLHFIYWYCQMLRQLVLLQM